MSVIRAEQRFFARQKQRIHAQLALELYERLLGKILVHAVETEFLVLDLGMDDETARRIEETF